MPRGPMPLHPHSQRIPWAVWSRRPTTAPTTALTAASRSSVVGRTGTYAGERWESLSGLLLTSAGPQILYPFSGTSWVAARAVNDSGLVVGTDNQGRSFPRAWGARAFPLRDPPLPDYSTGEALAVNDQNWIAGWSGSFGDQYSGTDVPMLWKSDRAVVLRLPDGAKGAHVQALSDTGVVGGYYWRLEELGFNESTG
jgi:hypothetical protein